MNLNLDIGISHILLVVGVLLWTWAIANIFTQRYTPAGTSAWLLAILLMPYIGVPLYAIFGGRKLRKIMRRKAHLHLSAERVLLAQEAPPLDRMLRGLGVAGATDGNRFRLCQTADDSYETLCRLIEGAQQTLDLEIYVFKNDSAGRDVIRRLADKAQAGVKVRLLYDSVGSLKTKRAVFQPLIDAGGRVVEFLPTGWWPFRARSNLRNHRKMLIADGQLAWSGGMNIGDEYMGPLPNPARWLDLSYEIVGPAVQILAEVFATDWAFATEEDEIEQPPPVVAGSTSGGGSVLQIVPSGPDVDYDPLYAAIATCAFQAERRLWICTPYFVPNEPLTEALGLAALRGVDLRIILPRKSNHWPCDIAREPYLRDIQRDGGKVLLHPKMLHAKVLLVDDTVAIYGSANIDARSLFLNFEVATFCYGAQAVGEGEAWLRTLQSDLEPQPLREGLRLRLSEGLIRLIAPLL